MSKSDVNRFLLCLNHLCRKEGFCSYILEEHWPRCAIDYRIDEKFFLKLDIHFFEAWRGIVFLSAEHITRAGTVNDTGIKVASAEHQALIIWLTAVLQGAEIKEKYRSLIAENLEVISEGNRTLLPGKISKKFF